MYILPHRIHSTIELFLGVPIQSIQPVSGGSINEAFKINTVKDAYFLKYNEGTFATALFAAEVLGLKLLVENGGFVVPKILLQKNIPGYSFLLLEFIERGAQDASFWKKFGIALAHLHQNTAPCFGLDHDNFIGRLPQSNAIHDQWSTFYRKERIEPQMKMALTSGRLPKSIIPSFEKLFRITEELFPPEPATLTHGDLWAGNFLASANGTPLLIDPAVSYAHREMDLAMTYLFGGFNEIFYHSYEAVYPLVPGFQDRIDFYQLYYLLVHVNLFGGSYVHQVLNILKKVD